MKPIIASERTVPCYCGRNTYLRCRYSLRARFSPKSSHFFLSFFLSLPFLLPRPTPSSAIDRLVAVRTRTNKTKPSLEKRRSSAVFQAGFEDRFQPQQVCSRRGASLRFPSLSLVRARSGYGFLSTSSLSLSHSSHSEPNCLADTLLTRLNLGLTAHLWEQICPVVVESEIERSPI